MLAARLHLFAAVGVFLAATAQAETNLIASGAFDGKGPEASRGWRPVTYTGQADFAVEPRSGRDGSSCVRISSDRGADASWTFTANVKPKHKYRLSAWIKTQDLKAGSGLGALLNLHELQQVGKTAALVGSRDWTEVVTEFESGPHQRLHVNLLFGGWGRSSGTAWFDDVQLVDLGSTDPTLAKIDPAWAQMAPVAFYNEKVKPVLTKHCYECHAGQKISGGLRINYRDTLLHGGDTGAAIDEENPDASLLLEAVRYESYEMPPKGKLPAEEIAVLTHWARLKAPFPEDQLKAPHDAAEGGFQITPEHRAHWAYRPVQRPLPPAVEDREWVANPLDAFVLAKLEAEGLQPAAPAEKTVLLRRAYYDLIGLPPTPAEVEAFLKDESPDAFEKVVDRLLDSPQYGERWGRHWLDLVRYAESNSYERDNPKPLVWRYRDYVIRALNEDKPFDQFVLEQLAGDELPEPTRDSIIATGYYRLGVWDDEPADREQALYDDLDDIVKTTGEVLLGMRIGCARCHDHKLDPLPQRDYYRMLSFFNGLNRYGVRSDASIAQFSIREISTADEKMRQADAVAAHRREVAAVEERLGQIEQLIVDDLEPVEKEEFQYPKNRPALLKARVPKLVSEQVYGEYMGLRERQKRLENFTPPGLDKALCVTEIGAQPRETYVLVRGNPHVRGEQVAPALPEVLGVKTPPIESPAHGKSSGRRLALAQWIASEENPLTSRVLANRLFQYHFGRGIVGSPNDFGLKGNPPTHPAMLDWLASELVDGGWRLKRMHKLIMLSNAYQMGGNFDKQAYAKDPENKLLWRFDMRRLSAEEVRDSMLAVAGNLNPKMGGPSIYPKIPRAVLAGQSRPGAGWGRSSPEEAARRSVYVHIKRSLSLPILESFDAADTDNTCPVRFATTQPTQALETFNGEFVNEQAAVFAKSAAAAAEDRPAQVRWILERALQRNPTEQEVARGLKLLDSLERRHGLQPVQALEKYCLVALNLNEFLYLD